MSNSFYYHLSLFFLSLTMTMGIYHPGHSQSFYIYQDEYFYFTPYGFMPDGDGISVQSNSRNNPFSGIACVSMTFNLRHLSQGWAGVYWLTNSSWKGPGMNIYDALKVSAGTPVNLTFWVRGMEGGEQVQFKVGGISEGNDSIRFPVATSWLVLSPDWQRVEIALNTQDLSNVVGGVCVITNRARNPNKDRITLFLDEIRFEVIQ